VGHEEAAAVPGAPAGESAPEFPPQRGPETPAPPRVAPQVPAPRPEAAEQTERAEPDAPDADEAAEVVEAAETASGPSGPPEADPDEGDAPEADTREAAAETADASTRRPSASPAATSTATATHGLGARERAVLEFERRRWKHAGAKEQAIRDEFDLSATRYYQILNALLDDPAALAHSPALVGRLRRVREARQRARH